MHIQKSMTDVLDPAEYRRAKLLFEKKTGMQFLSFHMITPLDLWILWEPFPLDGDSYTEEEKHRFATTLPGDKHLLVCADLGLRLVPGPPKKMSLIQVYDEIGKYFSAQAWWPNDSPTSFVHDENVEPKWYAFTRSLVFPSELNPNERIATASEVVWYNIVIMATKKRILTSDTVRTSSVNNRQEPVYVRCTRSIDDGWITPRTTPVDVIRISDSPPADDHGPPYLVYGVRSF